jgi:hypothetical protein
MRAACKSRPIAPLKETKNFAVKFRDRRIVRLAARIEDDCPLRAQLIQMQANGLSEAPLDSVTHDGFADGARNREADAWTGSIGLADTKSGEEGAGVPGTLVVNSSEVLRTQQTDTFRKTRDGGLPLVADSELFAASRTATGKNGTPVLGFHTGTEAVGFGTVTVIRLKSTFRHCGSSI